MYPNRAAFQSAIILLPSPVDDRLVFGLGHIWTTVVVSAKLHVHTNSPGGCSSFLSGPQKMLKSKCGKQAFSISSPHLSCCRQMHYGVSETAPALTQLPNMFHKASIKVLSIATWSAVTRLIKMLCLLWSEGCIYQLKSLGARKILRCQAAS